MPLPRFRIRTLMIAVAVAGPRSSHKDSRTRSIDDDNRKDLAGPMANLVSEG